MLDAYAALQGCCGEGRVCCVHGRRSIQPGQLSQLPLQRRSLFVLEGKGDGVSALCRGLDLFISHDIHPCLGANDCVHFSICTRIFLVQSLDIGSNRALRPSSNFPFSTESCKQSLDVLCLNFRKRFKPTFYPRTILLLLPSFLVKPFLVNT